jgi:hypothetical protein
MDWGLIKVGWEVLMWISEIIQKGIDAVGL